MGGWNLGAVGRPSLEPVVNRAEQFESRGITVTKDVIRDEAIAVFEGTAPATTPWSTTLADPG